ncbi:hypothetical protein CXB51_021408 [Gossypium anomalum]|uniref:DUF7745 domain-containing protein n=1 Tax=Gossypium anomalum TaxID=47600 RepID=A0A8J5YVA4_9ROSI|nr:hypothetical protein CXB51_021408 [Gossypium anomalum]
MRPSINRLKQRNKRRVIVLQRGIYQSCGISLVSVDLPYLLDIKVDNHLFRALAQFWNPTYSCFTFGKMDLVPTVEVYTALLCCPKIQIDKAYSRASNVPTLLKKLMNITCNTPYPYLMSEQGTRYYRT